MSEKCDYMTFLLLFPYCEKRVQEELQDRLMQQARPHTLCGREVPQDLNKITYGVLDDLRSAVGSKDPVAECAKVLLDIEVEELLLADVNDVFGFANFMTKELTKINKLFASIKHSYSKEEEAAGVKDLDFGSFGVLDWYARRMGIKNQNEVRDVAWVRIYQCMKNDNAIAEFERRLHKQYMQGSKRR